MQKDEMWTMWAIGGWNCGVMWTSVYLISATNLGGESPNDRLHTLTLQVRDITNCRLQGSHCHLEQIFRT